MKDHIVTMDRDTEGALRITEDQVIALAEQLEDAGIVDMEDARGFAFDEFVEEATGILHWSGPGATFTKTFNGVLRVKAVIA